MKTVLSTVPAWWPAIPVFVGGVVTTLGAWTAPAINLAELASKAWSTLAPLAKLPPFSHFTRSKGAAPMDLAATETELGKLAAEAPHLIDLGSKAVKVAFDLLRNDAGALVTDGRALAADLGASEGVLAILGNDQVAGAIAAGAIWLEQFVAAKIAAAEAAKVVVVAPPEAGTEIAHVGTETGGVVVVDPPAQ